MDWKQVLYDTHLQNLLFYTQICSMGQQVVFNYPIVSPEMPTMLTTLYSYLMGHHSHSFVIKNDWKWLKTVFDNTYLHNLLFYTQICSMGKLVVFNYPMVSPKVPTTLVIPHSYPVSHHSHSWTKMAENGWKQVFNHTYFRNLLFYTQICTMGQQVVF
jgi:hypothetical protein